MMANDNFRLSETNSERIFKIYCQMKIFLASWKSVLSQSFQYFTSKSFDFFKITPVFAERSQTSFSHVFNLCMGTICINNVLSETCKLLQNDEKTCTKVAKFLLQSISGLVYNDTLFLIILRISWWKYFCDSFRFQKNPYVVNFKKVVPKNISFLV